ncbi:MAG TPA: sigma-70 family RNA polymerase sigma factor [Planctomycetota bacterium]
METAKTVPESSDDLSKTDLLLGRARGGDQEAWRRLFERYRKMLRAHVEARIRGFARRRLDADDVLQAAFTRAWQQIERFEYQGEGSFRRWLARVVVNTCNDELAANWSGSLQEGATEQALADQAERAAQEWDERENRRIAMMEAMGQLEEEERDILIQRIVEELSFEAIGRNLGCSREKARELYAAAQQRLVRRMSA